MLPVLPASPVWRGRLASRAEATPFQLTVLAATATVAALLVLAAASLGIADSTRAFRAIGQTSGPSNDALDLYYTLSDMDADAAMYLLLGGRSTDGSRALEELNQYEQGRQTASKLLVTAALNPTGGTGEQQTAVTASVQRLQLMTQTFNFYVGRAVSLTDKGDTAGALAEYQRATDLMHAPFNGALETALALATAEQVSLTAAYDAAISEEGRDLVLMMVSGLFLVASLASLQLVLVRRTRRAVNIPAALASALALSLLVGVGSKLHTADADLGAAKRAFDAMHALRQVRASRSTPGLMRRISSSSCPTRPAPIPTVARSWTSRWSWRASLARRSHSPPSTSPLHIRRRLQPMSGN